MKIDELNASILKELLIDGRRSFTEIAQDNSTSKEVVATRYKQMKSRGIIVGATTQISQAYHDANLDAFLLIKTYPQKEESVTRNLTKIPNVFHFRCTGLIQDIIALAAIKNVAELETLRQSIKGLPFVQEVDTRLWSGIRNSPDNLSILGKDNKRIGNISKPFENHKIDEIDRAIIEKLAVNSRMPFSEIGKDLSLATDTIVRRYEKLRQNGDIRAVIQVNPILLGYSAFATFNLGFSHEQTASGLEVISDIPDINLIFKTSGKFDFMVTLMIRSIEQFVAVQERISNIPGLQNYDMSIDKMFTVWPNPKEAMSTF
jgi:Transcriptional regulators